MTVVEPIDRDEDKKLLAGWFETVQFDQESAGIPEVDPDPDDDPDEQL